MSARTREDQLRLDAAWYRAEHERLVHELDAMTAGHADAIGPAAIRRMRADADTFLELADEHDAYLAGRQALATTAAVQVDEGLF